MTAFAWQARGRWVAGLSAVGGTSAILTWSADPAEVASTVPWAVPAYPVLLVYGIGLTLTTSAVVANRRVRLSLLEPNSAGYEFLSSLTQPASRVRRWELGVGSDTVSSTAAGVGLETSREPLTAGLEILPGLVGGGPAQLTISIDGAQAGDSFGQVSVLGYLLPG